MRIQVARNESECFLNLSYHSGPVRMFLMIMRAIKYCQIPFIREIRIHAKNTDFIRIMLLF